MEYLISIYLKEEEVQIMSKKDVTLRNCQIIFSTKMNCSVNGGPKWEVKWEDKAGDVYSGRTGTDSQSGYTVGNFQKGQRVDITYHETATGNLIITKVKASISADFNNPKQSQGHKLYLWTDKACNHEENELVLDNGHVVNETYPMWIDFPITAFECLLKGGIVRPLDTLNILSVSHYAKAKDSQYLVVAKWPQGVKMANFATYIPAYEWHKEQRMFYGAESAIMYDCKGEELNTWNI